jgi:Xaa-Pro dipeptidase
VAAGGVAAASGLAASCFAQAVSISAATSALRASLVFIDRYPKEKQEWYENDTNEFSRSASPYGSLTANSIESTVVLKQPAKLSVVYDIEQPLFVFAAQRTFARQGVIWQADLQPLRGRQERKMSDVGSRAELISALDGTFGPHLEALCRGCAQALADTRFGALLVHSGSPLMIFADDQPHSFQVNAAFKVWVPLSDVPDSFIYFEPGARPRLLFYSPPDYWHQSAALPQAYWTRHFDIIAVADREAARKALPQSVSTTAYIGDGFAELASWGVAAINPPDLQRRLDFARAAKTPYELECMREASRLGALGHHAAALAFQAGASEFEIELAFLRACGLREQELPYNPIIALNEGGAVLHYQLLQRQSPLHRHSMLIDAGAEFGGYASDITRTHSFGNADFAALVRSMDDMQQALCAGIRAGVDWRDVHLRAHQLTAILLRDADITSCSPEEAVASGITSVFLPHGIGHLLGLQVHDVGGFMLAPEGGDIPRPPGHPFLRLTRVLQEGFVVTMEPGIYFNDQLLNAARTDSRGTSINWPRVQALRRFGGIRVEDNLAVTASGCENLTRDGFAAVAGQ